MPGRHLKGSRKLQFTGGFISGFSDNTGSATNSGSALVTGTDGTATSSGTSAFNSNGFSSGFLLSPFGTAQGRATGGASGSQVGISGVLDIGTSLFAGNTDATGFGFFGAGFSPPVAGQPFGPIGGFGGASGTNSGQSTSSGTNAGVVGGLSTGSNIGTFANFGSGQGTGTVPNFASGGGTGSGLSGGTTAGGGSSANDPLGGLFSGTGILNNVNFNAFGAGIFAPGGGLMTGGGSFTFPGFPP